MGASGVIASPIAKETDMASSTLDMTGEEAPITTRGHGIGALGPSDSSDTGSDIVGGPGMDEGLSDEQTRRMPQRVRGTAGRDVGDYALDADSDRYGTGERTSAAVDSPAPNDVATTLHAGIESASDELDDPDIVEIERIDSDAKNVVDGDPTLDDAAVDDGAT
jgi:hypothetical protein